MQYDIKSLNNQKQCYWSIMFEFRHTHSFNGLQTTHFRTQNTEHSLWETIQNSNSLTHCVRTIINRLRVQ